VSLSIHDNGRGFDLADVPPNSLGLSIMRERAEKIGAKLAINSRIGEGTVVTIHTPIAFDNEEDHERR
jgi:signal transduction histidine kinase